MSDILLQEVLFQCIRVSYLGLFLLGFFLGMAFTCASFYYYAVKYNSYEVVPTSITRKKK